jgi:acyl transferase domain-containing protein/acyl carrier protein
MTAAASTQVEPTIRPGMDIAVIGMAGRFPGAADTLQFWDNIKNGVESLAFFSKEELEKVMRSPALLNAGNFIPVKGMLDDIEMFDAGFFGYSPREAEKMDPQMRMFHQCVWHALEDAAYDPGVFDGPIGLYGGAVNNIIWELDTLSQQGALSTTAVAQLCDKDHMNSWISYCLNLRGPCFSVETQCSTSLVAVHLACQGLLGGECDMAVAGGVSVTLPQKYGYLYKQGMIMSPDGHCRPFDARAGGTVFGNGAAAVVLKRIEDAIQHRDHIYAVIKGSAINNDGRLRAGYTAPGVEGQAAVIRTAQRVAQVAPEDIGYVEAHGTGTVLGDPIEIEALTLAFNTGKKQYCRIGSVKSNIGHLDNAAGAAGLIKAVLSLKHQVIPPSLHFETPNPRIDFENSPFFVNTRLTPWQRENGPLRAGVSSFGIGGTNAHVVLEEWPHAAAHPDVNEGSEKGTRHRLVLSARTPAVLDRMCANLAAYLKANPSLRLADVAYTLQTGRKSFDHQRSVVCSTLEETILKLSGPGHAATTDTTGLQEIKSAGEHRPRRVPLPGYVFDTQHYSIRMQDVSAAITGAPSSPGDAAAPDHTHDPSGWYYIPSWERADLPSSSPGAILDRLPADETWLLFSRGGVADLLHRYLESGAFSPYIITVHPGTSFERLEDNAFTLDPSQSEHYDRLFQALKQEKRLPRRILHLWGAAANGIPGIPGVYETAEPLSFEDIQRQMDTGLYSLIEIVRSLGRLAVSHPLHLETVTVNMHEVTGREALEPLKAAVRGALRVIPREYPNISCRSIDIPMIDTHSPDITGHPVLEWLLDEILRDPGGKTVAFRGDHRPHRWQETFSPVTLEKPEAPLPYFKHGGVCLITGGLGGIGLVLARRLAQVYQARLVLTGRTALPPREQWPHWLETHPDSDAVKQKIRRVIELEESGARVVTAGVDAAHPEAVDQLIRRVLDDPELGTVDGVIHAAGLADYGGIMQRRTRQSIAEVMAPKVTGVLVLDQALKDAGIEPAVMVLCSSLSGLLGPFGEVAYTAANAFLDAYAVYRGASSTTHTVSIGWCAWKETGMAVKAASRSGPADGILKEGLSNEEAIDVFQRVLASGLPCVAVSKTHLPTLLRRANTPAVSKPPAKTEIDKGAAQRPVLPRPELSTPYSPPRSPLEKTIAPVIKDFLGIDKVGIHDNFFDLGVSSMDIVQIAALLESAAGMDVPVVAMFTYATVESLAGHLLEAKEEKI